MKRREFIYALGSGVSVAALPTVTFGAPTVTNGTPIAGINLPHLTEEANAPIVYYSPVVSSDAMIKLLETLNPELRGKVGIKLTFANESDAVHKINPDLIKPMVDKVKGTLIDSNYFDSARSDTASHLRTAAINGFDKVGPIDILDTEGEIELPVKGGHHLKTFITGSHLANYETLISVVRFKGHNLPRYGGTIKNLSICLGTPRGAAQVHSGGTVTEYYSSRGEKVTSESMADATKAALDFKPGRWVFFNIIDAMAQGRRDSCDGVKDIGDIGILLSKDPVAVDRAACDIVYGFAPSEAVRKKWEEEHFTDAIAAAEKIGAGSSRYRLVVVR